MNVHAPMIGQSIHSKMCTQLFGFIMLRNYAATNSIHVEINLNSLYSCIHHISIRYDELRVVQIEYRKYYSNHIKLNSKFRYDRPRVAPSNFANLLGCLSICKIADLSTGVFVLFPWH